MKQKHLNLTKMENKEERRKENRKKRTVNNFRNWKAMQKTVGNVDDRILRYFIIKMNQIIEFICYL